MADGGYQIRVQTVYSARLPQPAGAGVRLVAILTVLVGLLWLYVAWFPLYKWIERSLVLGEFNITSTVMNRAAGAAGQPANPFAPLLPPAQASPPPKKHVPPDQNVKTTPPPASRTVVKPVGLAPELQAEIERARLTLGVCAFGWLTLATLAGFFLTTAGAASGLSGTRVTSKAWVPLVAGIAAAGAIVWYVWVRYQWYQLVVPAWVMPTLMALVVIVAGALGAALQRHAHGLLRGSGILVVFSALASIGAIWAAVRWGEMPAENINRALYFKVFAIQSAYGWFLILATLGRS